MTEHDKVEHVLPNGDILIVESTRVDEQVTTAFETVRQGLRDEAREAFQRLRDEPTRDEPTAV